MKVSKIDDKLTIYKKNEVIIWGISSSGMSMYEMLQAYGIKVVAFCDNNPEKWGQYIDNIKVIEPAGIKKIYSNNTLIQIASVYELEIKDQLIRMGIDNYLLYSEAKIRLETLKKYKLFDLNKQLFKYYLEVIFPKEMPDIELDIWKVFMSPNVDIHDDCIILCMPPKTGDNTIQNSLDKERIKYGNLWHSTYYMSNELRALIANNKKIKIVTAVREPISQNLSLVYQRMGEELYWNTKEYWENGGNVQKIFDTYISEEMSYYNGGQISNLLHRRYKEVTHVNSLIQNFFEYEFEKRWGINLYEYPFDTEKGYSIIKINNVEILVYQLEKLNDNYKEILGFLGMSKPQLVMGNDSKNKWYFPYYEEAKKQIRFSKKYYDECYDTMYVKHFYSEEDINRFKERWKKNVSAE